MTLERNKTLIRDFIDAVNRQDWAKLDDLIAPAVVRHSAPAEQPRVRSREELVQFLRREAQTFPDAHETIHFLVAEGDKVAARLGFRGTQQGRMGVFPASGRKLSADFIAIFRIEAERIAEVWVEWDNLHALIHLGHLKLPAAT